MIKAIVFDYGGTLDTDGIHWCRKFLEIYKASGVEIPENVFMNAFAFSEKKMQGSLQKNDNLLETLRKQVSYQVEYLTGGDKNEIYKGLGETAEKIIQLSYEETRSCIYRQKGLLEKLSDIYMLGIISNFYGNLDTILAELNIIQYFSAVIDSEVIGFRKPNEKIFQSVLENLSVESQNSVLIGDSYEKDIVPAKKLGFTTVWHKGKRVASMWDETMADYSITCLAGLTEVLKIIENKKLASGS